MEELRQIDKKFDGYALHLRDDTDRLYMPNKEEIMISSTEDCLNASI